MKSLTNFIEESKLLDYYGVDKNSQRFFEYNRFIEDIVYKNTISKEWYEDYFNSFIILERFIDYDFWQDFLYETLMNTADTQYMIDKINKKWGKYIEEFKISKSEYPKYKAISIKTKDYKSLLADDNFISFCNQGNYEIIHKGDTEMIILKPWRGKEVTDEIMKHKYIYHVTPNDIWEIIQKKGMVPKIDKRSSSLERLYFSTKTDDIDQDFRTQTFANNKIRYAKRDNDELLLKRYKNGFALLKIDVSKLPKQIRFFEDSGGSNGMFWTYEYIPPYAISKEKDIDLSRYKKGF